MKQHDNTRASDASHDFPDHWSTDELRRRWADFLLSLMEEEKIQIPLKRIQSQVLQDPLCEQILRRWEQMNAQERLDAWKSLIRLSDEAASQILPTCVACGECCRRGSPTLLVEDLELLQQGQIPWLDVFTLRRGEPARSPYHQKLFFLEEERIKILEKEGSAECIFLDSETDKCGIYSHRPVQCRAQACWDPKAATELAKAPHLTRREIFQGVDLLLDLIEEHDQRCTFEKLKDAFERMQQSNGETIEEVLQILSYEDHFRNFLSKKLNIPEENLHLVFGRSYAELASLFGFKVFVDADGSRCLVPDAA